MFRATTFILKILFALVKKTCYLNEEANCTEPSPLFSVPCIALSACGLCYKCFTSVIYNLNDSGLYFKTSLHCTLCS